MKPIQFKYSNIEKFVNQQEIDNKISENLHILQAALAPVQNPSEDLGWIGLDEIANEDLLRQIEAKVKEIKEKADIFLLIGVGGSNQGARAVIKALGGNKPEVLYAGNNLSPQYLNRILSRLEGKSVYVNVIAKNFATLEPGITFRVIRNYMEKVYGEKGAAERIIATGSLNNSSLEVLGKQKGYKLFPFPLNVGGRFSVLTAVGLFPIAVAGVDIRQLIQGAKDMKSLIYDTPIAQNPAVLYGIIRNILLEKGYSIEILAFFEPLLEYFSKWWVQLFGESEGKKGKGIFPTACSLSEDLHSLGQYIQEGQRILFETFLNVEDPRASLKISVEQEDGDGFNYLNGKDFAFLNHVAYEATVKAHVEGGVPCIIVDIPELNSYYMGQLFYFFEYACYISGTVLGVDPFDQPGVEAYKTEMFKALREI